MAIRSSRARNGTITACHSDPFALCEVMSWIALSSAEKRTARGDAKSLRNCSANPARIIPFASASAACASKASSSRARSPNSVAGNRSKRSRNCVCSMINVTASNNARPSARWRISASVCKTEEIFPVADKISSMRNLVFCPSEKTARS